MDILDDMGVSKLSAIFLKVNYSFNGMLYNYFDRVRYILPITSQQFLNGHIWTSDYWHGGKTGVTGKLVWQETLVELSFMTIWISVCQQHVLL